jgi:uncharacterized protein (DUF2236 family)
MRWFVKSDSIVRRIWGKPDTVLFIFAGAAAEFALNKAVDWLFFTGKLPADPLGRLFSTVTYARRIVFSETSQAHAVIDRMAQIHLEVEKSRGSSIPAWAYLDVLYMLIDYSIRSFELLTRKMNESEKEEVYDVFRRVGARMGIQQLPDNYAAWTVDRDKHLSNDLAYSDYSDKLYSQYRRHLGLPRYYILRAAQGIIVPAIVRQLLRLHDSLATRLILDFYRKLIFLRMDWIVKSIILPRKYVSQVREIGHPFRDVDPKSTGPNNRV